MKSLIALSMHKAGTNIADQILALLCQARGYRIEQISLGQSRSPLAEQAFYVAAQAQMAAEGVYYGILRGPYVAQMPRLLALRAVVQVRDPRDCITSAYFSFTQSHRLPDDPARAAAQLAQRQRLKDIGLDGYARHAAGQYRIRLEALSGILAAHDDILLLRYEDMVGATEAWLTRIAGFLDQPLTAELRQALAAKIDFTPPPEDAKRHRRQVSPGDHRRKLGPETIAAMDQELGPQLARFGYRV